MEKTVKRPGWWQVLLIGMGSVLSVFFSPLMAVASGLLAYLGVAGSWWLLLAAGGVLTLCLLGLIGLPGLWLLPALLLPALLITALCKRRAAWFDVALGASCCSAAGMYALFAGPDLLQGYSAFHTLQEKIMLLFQSMAAQIEFMPPELPLGMDQAAVLELGRVLRAQLPLIMPGMLCAFGAVAGLCGVLIAARLSRRAGAAIKPMRPFRLWQVPTSYLRGLLTMAAGVVLLLIIGLPAMDTVLPAVLVVALAPFFVQGMSLAAFLFRARRPGCMLYMLIPILLFFPMAVLPFAIMALTTLGLLEQVLHLRQRIMERGNGTGA